MPRAGRRPGAGAPKGNLNAFRTGKHSAQYKRLLEILSRDPEAVRLLEEIALGDRQRAERRRRYAMRVLNQVLQRQEMDALDRAIDEWERSRTIPSSVLNTPGPTLLPHRKHAQGQGTKSGENHRCRHINQTQIEPPNINQTHCPL